MVERVEEIKTYHIPKHIAQKRKYKQTSNKKQSSQEVDHRSYPWRTFDSSSPETLSW